MEEFAMTEATELKPCPNPFCPMKGPIRNDHPSAPSAVVTEVEVTQIDVSQRARDAVADYRIKWTGLDDQAANRIKDGLHDRYSLVQAFARFERDILASTQAGASLTAEQKAGPFLRFPVLRPPYSEDHPLLAPILDKRRQAAGDFTPEFSGQRFADFDRGLMCAYEVINGVLQQAEVHPAAIAQAQEPE
jgi:hypothetical protein